MDQSIRLTSVTTETGEPVKAARVLSGYYGLFVQPRREIFNSPVRQSRMKQICGSFTVPSEPGYLKITVVENPSPHREPETD